MGFRNAKLARIAAGAAIVSTAGLTTAVAMAHDAPSGRYGGDEAGQYRDAAHGYGDEGGQARGHRLHCPSYNGMEHSKGHAQCHMAPRHGEDADGTGDRDEDTKQQAGVLSLEVDKSTTTTTAATAVKGTEAARDDADDAEKPTTTTTQAPRAASPQATTDPNCDHDGTKATTESRDSTDNRAGSYDGTRDGDQRDGDRSTGSDGTRDGQRDGRHRD